MQNIQKEIVIKSLEEMLNRVKKNEIESIFLVSTLTKPTKKEAAIHMAFAGDEDFMNLLGNVEKCKIEIVDKIIASEQQ